MLMTLVAMTTLHLAATSAPSEFRPTPAEFLVKVRKIEREYSDSLERFLALDAWRDVEPRGKEWAQWFDFWSKRWEGELKAALRRREDVKQWLRPPSQYEGESSDLERFRRKALAGLKELDAVIAEFRELRAARWPALIPDFERMTESYRRWVADKYRLVPELVEVRGEMLRLTRHYVAEAKREKQEAAVSASKPEEEMGMLEALHEIAAGLDRQREAEARKVGVIYWKAQKSAAGQMVVGEVRNNHRKTARMFRVMVYVKNPRTRETVSVSQAQFDAKLEPGDRYPFAVKVNSRPGMIFEVESLGGFR